jgi:hypothetical protein
MRIPIADKVIPIVVDKVNGYNGISAKGPKVNYLELDFHKCSLTLIYDSNISQTKKVILDELQKDTISTTVALMLANSNIINSRNDFFDAISEYKKNSFRDTNVYISPQLADYINVPINPLEDIVNIIKTANIVNSVLIIPNVTTIRYYYFIKSLSDGAIILYTTEPIIKGIGDISKLTTYSLSEKLFMSIILRHISPITAS